MSATVTYLHDVRRKRSSASTKRTMLEAFLADREWFRLQGDCQACVVLDNVIAELCKELNEPPPSAA